jgi:hypothetical protein
MDTIDKTYVDFCLNLARFGIIALIVCGASITIMAAILLWKSGGQIPENIASTGLKLATVVGIVLAASYLSIIKVVKGEAAIAFLSGIAGYVLGNLTSARSPSRTEKPSSNETLQNGLTKGTED